MGSSPAPVIERIGHVIFEHAARISREQDIGRLLTLNADLARDLVGADRCSLWLIDEKAGTLWTKVAHGIDQLRVAAGTGLVGASVALNETILVNDVSSDPRHLRPIDIATGYETKSALAVPLHVDGRVIGAMQLLNKPGGFSTEDAELLGFMACYSAAQIETELLRQEAESARLLQQELALAREVQMNLLPTKLAPIRGVECSAFCRPARFVGGDYYDLVELPGGLFGLTLGDVSGKGMPAAVLMASIQAHIRALMLRDPFSLSRVFTELNDAIYRCTTLERYSTLFCGVLNADRTVLTYINAGHIPPMILHSGSTYIQRPPGAGFPLGLLPAITYEEYTIPMQSRDLIVFMSDGISEALNVSGDMLQEQPIERLIAENSDASVSDLIQWIIEATDAHSSGTEQHDDITVAAARIL
jgi:sigma-B regulation protein RsbU (phosphoserine phosphatase)